MSLSVKAHNILKSLSMALIAIGGLSASTVSVLPDAAYIGAAVALSGVAGYALANALVDPSTELQGAENVIAAIQKTAETVKSLPAPTKPTVDAATIAAAEAAVNAALANYKKVAAGSSP